MAPQPCPSKPHTHNTAEPMEGITAPPASPTEANFSSASNAANKENDEVVDKSSPRSKHRAPAPAGDDVISSEEQQAASTKYPEQVSKPLPASQPNSADTLKPENTGKTKASSKIASRERPENEVYNDFSMPPQQTSKPKPSAQEAMDDERDGQNVSSPSENNRDKQFDENENKVQPVSPVLDIDTEEVAGRKKYDPVRHSGLAEPPVKSNNPENPDSATEMIAVLPRNSTDVFQHSSGNTEPAAHVKHGPGGVQHNDTPERSSTEHSDLTKDRYIKVNEARVKNHIAKDSKQSRESLKHQPQIDSEQEEKSANKMDTSDEHILDLEPLQETEVTSLRRAKLGTSIEVGKGKVGNKSAGIGKIAGDRDGVKTRSSNREGNSNDSFEYKPESGQSGPKASKNIAGDAHEESQKEENNVNNVTNKGSDEGILTRFRSELSASESKAILSNKERVAKKVTPAMKQAVSMMEIGSPERHTEKIEIEGNLTEEAKGEHFRMRAGRSHVDELKVNRGNKSIPGDEVVTESSPPKSEAWFDGKSEGDDDNTSVKRIQRKLAQKEVQSRLLRTKNLSVSGGPDSSFDSGGKHDAIAKATETELPQNISETMPRAAKANEILSEDDGPRPVMGPNGLAMKVGNATFVTEDQLDEPKVARLNDKKVLPFERLTFKELRTYNRDQLRAYCFAYGMERRKKTEMEADMARYLSYWNRGKPGFALHEYVPTSGRTIDRDEFFGTRNSQANQSSASLGGTSFSGADISRRLGSRMQSSYADKGFGTGGQTLGNGSVNLQTSPSTPSAANANKNVRSGSTPATLPRGFTTSFKQRVHARQASAKFKAAYNGAGDTIVNVVENAAAYFEGKDSPEVIADQTKSFERYQFNVDLLTEIFDGPIEEDVEVPNVNPARSNGNQEAISEKSKRSGSAVIASGAHPRTDVMFDIAKRLLSNKRNAHQAELDSFETNLKRAEEKAKHMERRNMRLFQKLERAETLEQVETIKEEFEKEFGTPVDFTSRPVVRRKIDKTLPPLVIPDDQSRILRFTFL